MTNASDIISNLSKFFTEKYRITILLIVAILTLGFASYTNFLDREGFPPVQFPIGTVSVFYQGESIDEVNDQVTKPIEQELADLTEITQIQSTTTENNATLVIQFQEQLTSEEGMALVEEEISSGTTYPEEAQVNFNAIDPASVDGEYEFVFSLYSDDIELDQLITESEKLADEIEALGPVTIANIKPQFRETTNPRTGESTEVQTAFSKTGIKSGDDLEFYDSVKIGLNKTNNVDAIELSNAVKDKVSTYLEDKGLDNEIEAAYTADQADTVQSQIQSLEANAVSGFLIIVAVLFLFLNWRASIVAGLFMPLVLGATFTALYLVGGTLNTISLFGLILVLGLFVDDAIVVIESIFTAKRKGESGSDAIKQAVGKIATADISGTLTTVLVFAPMLAITGILGQFIVEIPLTVILALLISLVIALTIIPFLANIFINTSSKDETRSPIYYLFNGFSLGVTKLANKVAALVNFYLSKWYGVLLVVVLSILVLIAGIIPFASQVEFSIFPSSEESEQINVSIDFDSGLNISQAEEKAKEFNDILSMRRFEKYIENVDYFESTERSATVRIELTDDQSRDKTAAAIVDELEAESVNELSDLTVSVNLVGQGPPPSEFPFELQVYAEETETLESATSDIKEDLIGKEFEVTEENIIEITEVEVDNLNTVSKIDGERFARIRVKFDKEDPNTGEIQAVQTNLEDTYDADTLENLGLDSEEGIGFDQGVQTSNTESFESAIFAFGLSLMLMYILLVIQFNSFSQPFLVFMALPFSLFGIIPGLALTGNPFSFFVMIGIIAMSGIAVNNTIILLDYANQEREAGKSIADAAAKAVELRFRPLLTTTVTTVASLIPLAVTDPFWEPLAITIITGLAASTFTVILAFPAYFWLFEQGRGLKRRLVTKFR